MEGFVGVRKGVWTEEEDDLLRQCIATYGEGQWHKIQRRAGLNRCRKSCRLRWLNYLKPNIKKGQFEEDEVDLITKLHNLLGNKWSLIAGRLPGRTANNVKNFWNSNLRRSLVSKPKQDVKLKAMAETQKTKTIRPQPRYFSKNFIFKYEKTYVAETRQPSADLAGPTKSSSSQGPDPWRSENYERELWNDVLVEMEYNDGGDTSINGSGSGSYSEMKWKTLLEEGETQELWKNHMDFELGLWDIYN